MNAGVAPRPARQFPWHPLLFAAVIVATVWMDSGVSPYAMVRSMTGAVLAAGALTALGAVAMRSLQVGGIAATTVIWALWSKELLDVGTIAFDRLGPLAFLWLAAIAVALLLAARLLRRWVRAWTAEKATSLLNRFGLLLLIAGVLLGAAGGRMRFALSDLDQGVSLNDWAPAAGTAPTPTRPDIYVLLLDGYPRDDVLEYAFGIDNSVFTDALADRGFSVAPLAHSDYLWTHVSVPSALNLAYVEQIPTLADVIAGNVPQQPTIRHAIDDNLAFEVAREHAYETVAVASGFEEVSARKADVWVDGGQMTEFEVSLLASTFLGEIVGTLAPDLGSSQHRDRILENLAVLPRIAALRDRPPALVYAHIPAPHQPTVFGKDGLPVAVPISDVFYSDSPIERDEDRAEFVARYRAQLPYLNERVLETIDAIVAASSQPPVVVLFADHGSASRTDWNETDPAMVDPTVLLERTATLFASRTPGKSDVYPDDVSPVDLFRLLFDAYFGTAYGRAEPPSGGGQISPVEASVLDASSAAP